MVLAESFAFVAQFIFVSTQTLVYYDESCPFGDSPGVRSYLMPHLFHLASWRTCTLGWRRLSEMHLRAACQAQEHILPLSQ